MLKSSRTASFAEKFCFALETLNYSRARCAQELGLHKSIVARWASGDAHPTEHNLARLTELVQRVRPGFPRAAWRLGINEFARSLNTIVLVSNLKAVVCPSVAVLTFDNLSGDPAQGYFSDGVAEDIITELTRNRALTVIARNSSFGYGPRPNNIRQVGRELGVRYALTGSVRRDGNRIRINAQLIETESSSHVWAERYDVFLADLFSTQDAISSSVVHGVDAAIADLEMRHAMRKSPSDFSAWEAYQRGLWHFTRFAIGENREAQDYFRQAIALDPSFSPAYQALAFTHLDGVRLYSTDNVADGTGAAEILARKAVATDPADPAAHAMLGYAFATRGDLRAAIGLAEQAVERSPNCSLAWYVDGVCKAFDRHDGTGEQSLLEFLRLSPRDPKGWRAWANVAAERYLRSDYEGAVAAGRDSLRAKPDQSFSYRWVIAALGQLGDQVGAQALMARATAAVAPISFDDHVRNRWPWVSLESNQHLLAGLRKGGWRG